MVSIRTASEQYRVALANCREVFSTAGRDFVEPAGIRDLLAKAREAYTVNGDEAAAVKEAEHAQQWLNGIATKFLRGGIEFFEGRVKELSYMSLDADIMDNLETRLQEYREAVEQEQAPAFSRRIQTYTELLKAVTSARAEQLQRNEDREQQVQETAREQELERKRQRVAREREREQEETLRHQAANAQARAQREQQFDTLFG